MKKLVTILIILSFAFGMLSCEEKSSGEKAIEAIGKARKEAVKELQDAKEEVEEELKKAKKELEIAKEEVEEELKKAKEEIEKELD